MIKKTENKQTFEQGASLLLISGLLVKIIGAFFKIPLSSNYCLGEVGFGYFSAVYDIFIPIYTLAVSGIPAAVSRIISEYLAENDFKKTQFAYKLFKMLMLIIGSIGTLVLILFAFPFVKLTDKTGNTLFCFLAMCPAVLFCFLSSVYRGYFEGNRNMLPSAVSNIIDAVSKLFLGLVGAFIAIRLTGNVYIAAASAMGGITLGTLLSFLFVRLYYLKNRNNMSFEQADEISKKEMLKRLLRISLPIVLSSVAISMVSFIDSLSVRGILSLVLDKNDYLLNEFNVSAELLPTYLYGVRSKAYTLFHLVPVFAGFIATSALPSLTKEFITDKDKSFKVVLNSSLRLTSVAIFPISMGLFFIGQPIMRLLYGSDSDIIGGKILSMYGAAALFAGIIMLLTVVLQAMNKQSTALINFLVGIIIKIIGNFVLISIPKLNILGSAISTLICFAYIFTAHFAVILKEFSFKPDIKRCVLSPFFSSLLCGITAFIICEISDKTIFSVLSIISAAVVYLIFLIFLKVFSLEEIREFIKNSSKFK